MTTHILSTPSTATSRRAAARRATSHPIHPSATSTIDNTATSDHRDDRDHDGQHDDNRRSQCRRRRQPRCLQIASMLSDTIMTRLFSERRHYCEYKTEVTPDFSDVRAKVEQLEMRSKTRQGRINSYA